MRTDWITRGFHAAAAFNIVGILTFTRGLTNTTLFELDPVMFSRMGCVLVMVWGLAYAAQSRSWRLGPAVSVVFAIEKLVYVVWWGAWLAAHGGELGAAADRDVMAAAFYGAYGLGDAAFLAFFLYAAAQAGRAPRT